jgi:transcription elongation factor GreA
VGCFIVLERVHDKEVVKYQIVGSGEADVFKNKISHSSPIGEVVIGKCKGDCVKALTPNGKIEYTIIEII